MNDDELLKAYALGLCMYYLLGEYGTLERRSNVARVYNAIKEKHNVFNKQIHDYEKKKKKKISKKCNLYILAGTFSLKAWSDAKDGKNIMVEATIQSIYFKNKVLLSHVYGFKDEQFNLVKNEEMLPGAFLSSVRTATRLIKNIEDRIAKNND